MINEENFITAHFIDNERKNIEVLLKSDDGTAVNPHILEYDVDNPNCQELLKLCSLDQLHENTYTKKQEERKAYISQIKNIAQKEGLIKDIIEAQPTDGLWDDSRNDERQLGLTYKQIEEAMDNTESKYYEKYMQIRKPNLHKMKPIPICLFEDD